MGEIKIYKYVVGVNIMQVSNQGERKRAIKRIEHLEGKIKKAQLILDKILLQTSNPKRINPSLTYLESIQRNIATIQKIKDNVLQEVQKFDEKILKKKEEKLKNAKKIN